MVVFYIFGIILAGAAAFDSSLTPGQVDPNLKHVNSQVTPVETEAPEPQECPQNNLLVKILSILTNSHSNLDGTTKAYVLSLLENVLRHSSAYNHGKAPNYDFSLTSNPADNALRHLKGADDKKVKITINYEFPASDDCQKSLESLHKIINALNETRNTEILNFEMKTENPEHYNLPNEMFMNKFTRDEHLRGLFGNPKNTNFMGLLQNYRPEESVPMHNGKTEVYELVPEKVNGPSQTSILNLAPINKLEPQEKVLWENSNSKPLNILDHIGSATEAPSNDLLKAVVSMLQPQQKSSISEINIVSNTDGQSSNVINNQNHNNEHTLVTPINKYESVYIGDQSKIPNQLAQYQPGVNFVSAKQAVNNDKLVEITYVLQQPKAVQYEPVYLIKYRLPLDVFEETVHKLVLIKPHLKQDQNQLYQELLASLKLDNRFSQVTELRSGKNNYVGNQMENNNDVLRSREQEIKNELDVIKELNSNVSSSDLLVINNETVENELKRLKRHPV